MVYRISSIVDEWFIELENQDPDVKRNTRLAPWHPAKLHTEQECVVTGQVMAKGTVAWRPSTYALYRADRISAHGMVRLCNQAGLAYPGTGEDGLAGVANPAP